jgi:manganese/zinc/iron transport system permease protein
MNSGLLQLSSYEWWTLLTALVCSGACSLVGTLLVVRRSALLSDAISHSILPGIALAFLLTGSRAPIPMFLGAVVSAVASGALTAFLSSRMKINGDAAMGIVFTTFFSLGVLLITATARSVDLDPGCVLYGLLEFIALDSVPIGGFEVPRDLITLSLLYVGTAVVFALFYKELLLASFDPRLASALGFSATGLHYGILLFVSAAAVAAFEAVGTILVISMLITPAATASLLTRRMPTLVILAQGIAFFCAITGYLLAIQFDTSAAGMMSVVGGVLFAGAVIASPHQGVIKNSLNWCQLKIRIEEEDFLGLLYRREEQSAETSNDNGLFMTFMSRIALWRLRRSGKIEKGVIRLTAEGRDKAMYIVRTHRLWESYLAKTLAMPADHLHAPSERIEHYTGQALAQELVEEVSADRDPHGRKIP